MNYKVCYIYHADTNEYLYPGKAYSNVRRTAPKYYPPGTPIPAPVAVEEVYTLPVNATFTEPPVDPGANKARLYDVATDSWNIVDDYRGTVLYSVTSGTPVILNDFGPIMAGYTPEKRPSEYHRYSDGAWDVPESQRPTLLAAIATQQQQVRARKLTDGFVYDGNTFPLIGDLYRQNCDNINMSSVDGTLDQGVAIYLITGNYVVITDVAAFVAEGKRIALGHTTVMQTAVADIANKTMAEVYAFYETTKTTLETGGE